MTALAVVSLIDDGALELTTTARSVLGDDLPLIRDDVTVEHLLAHRSGIGDYLDEDAGHDDHRLRDAGAGARARDDRAVPRGAGRAPDGVRPRRAVRVLQRRLRRARADRRTRERRPLPRPGARNGCASRPAMADTEFLRSDELPGTRRPRLPVGRRRRGRTSSTSRCAGTATAGSTRPPPTSASFWDALLRRPDRVDGTGSPRWCGPRSDWPEESRRYGLGFHLHASSDVVMLEGYDAGVSFRTAHDPRSTATYTVISNTSDGAWPIVHAPRRVARDDRHPTTRPTRDPGRDAGPLTRAQLFGLRLRYRIRPAGRRRSRRRCPSP